jgi:hypothetical protein
MIIRFLRTFLFPAFAQGQEHVALAIEHDPTAEVPPGSAFGRLAKQDLHILEAIADQPPAREFGANAIIAGA